ncbi:hypothetical protein RB597_005264 [Gaeumannomyces tritici]
MADPLAILGAATAGIQLCIGAAKSVLTVVKLLQELADAPKEVAEIISDLTLVESLVSDRLTIAGDLTPEQHARLSLPAAELRKAIESLAATLEALDVGTGGRKRDAIKRPWDRARYLRMRDEVRTHLLRIDRLSQEVKGVLLVIVADSLALTRDTAVRTHKLAEEVIVPDIRATNATLEVIKDNLGSGLEGVHQKLNFILALSTTPRQDEALSTPQQASGSTPSSTHISTALVATSHSSLPNSGPEAQNHWGPQAARQLVRYPSALAEACDVLQPMYRRRKPRCRCRHSTTTRSTAGGIFRYETESSEHTRECPRNESSWWRYSVSFMLAPFLNKAVELTLGATSGAGGWSLSPPIRVIPRVRAADSPALSIFRSIEGVCDWLLEPDGFHVQPAHPRNLTTAEVAMNRISNYYQHLEEYLRRRPTSVYEIIETDDEEYHPCTWDMIWGILSKLVGGLLMTPEHFPMGPVASHAIREGLSLIRLLCKRGVDPLEERIKGWNNELCRAWENEIDDQAESDWHPIYDTMRSLDALETFTLLDWSRPNPYRRRVYIKKHPDLRAYLEADLPELNVILMAGHSTKDLSRLQSISKHRLLTETFPYNNRWDRHSGYSSAARMALGWPEGLEYLVGLGCDVRGALDPACRRGDLDSVRKILRTPTALFSPQKDPLALVEAFRFRLPIFSLAVTELASRRRMLNNLALEILEHDQCAEFGLFPGKILVRHSAQVYEAITGKYHAVEIPESFHCHSRFSTYEFLLGVGWQWTEPFESWARLDFLLRAGFDDVNAPDESGETVLFKLRKHSGSDSNSWSIVLWLLHHSEQRTFPAEIVEKNRTHPGIQFHIAGAIGMTQIEIRTWQRNPCLESSQQAKTVLKASDATVTDGCVCFCSSSYGCSARRLCTSRGCCSPGGCLPNYMFKASLTTYKDVSLDYSKREVPAAILFQARNEALHKWARWCGISGMEEEEYYLQACRLELFERFEMAHTCCLSQTPTLDQTWLQHRICPDESERSEMREEDSDSARYLEAMLQEYRLARWKYRGKPVYVRRVKGYSAMCFWDLWLEAVDMVLPLPTDEPSHPHDKTFNEILEKHFRMVHRTLELIFHAHRVQTTTFVAARRRSARAAKLLTNMGQNRLNHRFKIWMRQRISYAERKLRWQIAERDLGTAMKLRKKMRRKLEEKERNRASGRIARQERAWRRPRQAIRHTRGIQTRHRYGRWILWVGFKKWAKALGELH